MDGFTIICHNCQTQSEYEKENERLTEDIKILIHDLTEICICCSKCGQKLKLN